MALNFSIFPPALSGRAGMAAVFNATGAGDGAFGQSNVVALGADSGAIAGPCLLIVTADERARFTLQRGSAPGADPSATGHLLVADAPYGFELGEGSWYIRGAAA